jgi:hypothetical protein
MYTLEFYVEVDSLFEELCAFLHMEKTEFGVPSQRIPFCSQRSKIKL